MRVNTWRLTAAAAIAAIAVTAGCATNPVTGKNELNLVSEAQEINIGNQNYAVSRQMQGGDYNVDPQLTAYVSGIGQKLAAVSDRKLPYEFKVLNNSVPNAWALPGGKIAINSGLLLEMDSEAELAAVLGHEIVHAAARHGAKGMERGILLQGAVLATGIAASGTDYSRYAIAGAQMAAGLISQKYGRNAESESDFYGMQYMARAGYDPRGAVDLQQTFVRISGDQRSDWLSGLFASHPPSQQRVDANRVTAASLPAGGITGREVYQQKIAHLKRAKPAYKAFADGQKALKEKRYQQALAFVQRAIELEPREGRFHALRGDVLQAQKRHQEALTDYDRALALENNYFYFHLQRGLANTKLNRRSAARADLEKSAQLLPTAIASKSLGDLARADGDKGRAKQYYRAAAQSKSALGQEALGSLVRLDLPENPGQYVKVRTGLNSKGYAVAEVSNPTPVNVGGIRLGLRFRNSAGQIRQQAVRVRRPITAGKAQVVQLGLGPFPNNEALRAINVQVIDARVVN